MTRAFPPVCAGLSWVAAALLGGTLGLTPAFAAKVTASSASADGPAANAFDGRRDTRWGSEFSDPQWLEIVLDKPKELVGLRIDWELAYASSYGILVSTDRTNWVEVYRTEQGDGHADEIDFGPVTASALRVEGRRRATGWGYSIFEITLKTAQEPWGEGEPADVLLRNDWPVEDDVARPGWRTWSSAFFIPQAWSNNEPFLQLADPQPPDARVEIDGSAVRLSEVAPLFKAGVVRIPLKPWVKFGAYNRISVTATGKVKAVLAAGTQEWAQAVQDYRGRGREAYFGFLFAIQPGDYYPYWMAGRQGYWTVAGAELDDRESLLCQDGTLEPYKSFSITPFLHSDGVLLTRDDFVLEGALDPPGLPLPVVRWNGAAVDLEIRAFAAGPAERSSTYLRYRLRNHGAETFAGRLLLALRPFEVNPPWQWGGYNRLHDIRRTNDEIRANEFSLVPLTPLAAFGATEPRNADIMTYLEQGLVPATEEVHDPDGMASGVLAYDILLQSGQTNDTWLAVALHPDSVVVGRGLTADAAASDVTRLEKKTIRHWQGRLSTLPLLVPEYVWEETLRANLGYLLIHRDGSAIQAGSRAYEASWIRDAAQSATVLLQCGFQPEVSRYLAWYGGFQYADGRVPAIVIESRREVNPVHEYDSQGEWIYLVKNYFRYSGDSLTLSNLWPSVFKSLKYLEALRNSELKDYYLSRPDERRYYGILPRSVSHEGYYPEPGNHSYWDDFWALRGWRDAQFLARELGRTNMLPWMREQEQALQDALRHSVSNAMAHYRVDYIPGCAELGDFDPSATAIAVMLDVDRNVLPRAALDRTFDRYLERLAERRRPGWTGSFSPYEARIADALIRLGRPAQALEVFEYLLASQRPAEWRQWPEAVYYPAEQNGYIGDMPHTWAAAGFVEATRTMFVYEDERRGLLICGAGLPGKWLQAPAGAGVRNAATLWGRLSYRMRREDGKLAVEISGSARPPNGFRIHVPFDEYDSEIVVNGVSLPVQQGSVAWP